MPTPEEVFKKLDKDGNGSISKDEFMKSHEEMKARMDKMRDAWKSRMSGKGPEKKPEPKKPEGKGDDKKPDAKPEKKPDDKKPDDKKADAKKPEKQNADEEDDDAPAAASQVRSQPAPARQAVARIASLLNLQTPGDSRLDILKGLSPDAWLSSHAWTGSPAVAAAGNWLNRAVALLGTQESAGRESDGVGSGTDEAQTGDAS